MDYVLSGFASELVKLSSSKASSSEDADLKRLYKKVKKRSQRGSGSGLDKIRGKGRKVSRDYLASTLIGATATPAAFLLGKRLSRSLHNRDVKKLMTGLSKGRKKALEKYIDKGPLVGRSGRRARGSSKPVATHGELADQAVRGGVMGSVIQALRDRYSGSAGKGDHGR